MKELIKQGEFEAILQYDQLKVNYITSILYQHK